MSYKIGTKVRIECNNESKRGIISYINKHYNNNNKQQHKQEEKEEKEQKEEDKNIIYSYDIIYYDNKEENEVNEGHIYELLQLEYNCEYINLTTNNNNNNKIDINSISLFKECGNNLFEIKDYSAAYEYYMKVFKYIQDQKLTIGQRVLIKVGNGPTERFEIGMLSDIHNGDIHNNNNNSEKYDVIYDSLVDSSDEEENIDRNRIINIYQDESSENPILALELQRSIFMNLSKTATKRKLKGWAVRWALLAMGLIKGELTKFPEDKRGKYFTDSLFILSKAFLSSSRPQLAKKVAHELSYVERSFSISPKLIRSNNLMKEIDQFILKKQKENKILAKNIAEWVDTAMTINQQQQQQQQQQNQQKKQQNRDNYNMNEEEDVNIGDDLEDIHVEFNNDYDYDDNGNFRSGKGEAKERNHKNNSKCDEGGDLEEKNSSKRNDSDDSDHKNNIDANQNNYSNQKNEDCLIS